ncbi:exopolyphosphatase [Marinobacterium arenosum]|uniref:exopolyphosphatase n=1 Tax=Marinobacterium arenosum TaxID=2862496 RepID=UPI001C96670B|nr:exopolyphosphatase [Marinobacterium arenosum]MBY4676920.1 exopolyphosphatase [Marinobacterium arenosum]
MQNAEQPAVAPGQLLAAIDLGSNSFHMVVARLEQGELKPVEVMSEKVQLAAGLNADKMLDEDAQQRAFDCLSRFAQRIQDLPRDAVRITGTNALREARNSQEICEQVERILGVSLEIISGREEARLIFLGVSHSQPDNHGRRLVVDIGGGSTECIIGERFEALELESLHIGCVSYTQQFFADGKISKSRFKAAETAAMQELQSIRGRYKQLGWTSNVGSSGTVKAINNACTALGLSNDMITAQALQALRDKILQYDHTDEIDIDTIKPERCAVLPAGIAILSAIFQTLDIDQMSFSDGALREGLLYEMAGRLRHEDVRERTISALMQRYHVDIAQANRVETTALLALAQAKKDWQLEHESYHDMLSWAARTHEIGLTISNSQYHKHSAYLLAHSDLPGFTNLDQLLLGTLARGHRRKFPKEEFKQLPKRLQEPYRQLCILLRLAVILHRNRSINRPPAFSIEAEERQLTLRFPDGWLENHPLTLADMEVEQQLLANIDYQLQVS